MNDLINSVLEGVPQWTCNFHVV